MTDHIRTDSMPQPSRLSDLDNGGGFTEGANYRPLAGKLAQLWEVPWLEKVQRAAEFYWLLKSQYYYRWFLGSIGKRSKLIEPMRLRNLHHISIGSGVIINKHAFLLTWQEKPSIVPKLIIGDGCKIGHMNHIACIREVRIGRKVLTADRVYISDHSHGYTNVEIPIMDQPVVSKGPVSIGDGTWIGENVAILSCNIGKHCVIGANAVVLSDIPDYSVAVGAPARVIQRFDPAAREWQRVARS